jgi:hypothetical protein
MDRFQSTKNLPVPQKLTVAKQVLFVQRGFFKNCIFEKDC